MLFHAPWESWHLFSCIRYICLASEATVLILGLFCLTFFQKFSSASKYAALLMDGDQGDDAEDVE